MPESGATGWTSFGIAGLVLAWLLLKHLPAKDAQIERLISRSDTELRDARKEYKDALASIAKELEVGVAIVQKAVGDEMLRNRDALHALRNVVAEVNGKIQLLGLGVLKSGRDDS